MPKTTCSVAQCERPAKSRGWCHAHYMFWYKNRTEPTGAVRKWGQRRTVKCAVDGCESAFALNGYCAAHWKRVEKYGDPGSAEIKPRSVGDAADYALAHARLKKTRGPASNHGCVGCESPAQHWAYDHRDPNEKTDHRGYSYSLKAEHYRPMCVKCHKRFDMNRINGTPFEQFETLGSE